MFMYLNSCFFIGYYIVGLGKRGIVRGVESVVISNQKFADSQKIESASSTTRPTSTASFSSGTESSTSSSAPTAGGETSTASFSSGTESSTSASHSRVGATAFLRRITGSSRGTRSKLSRV